MHNEQPSDKTPNNPPMSELHRKQLTRGALNRFEKSMRRNHAVPLFCVGVSQDPNTLGQLIFAAPDNLTRDDIAGMVSRLNTMLNGYVKVYEQGDLPRILGNGRLHDV